jgi:cystine transport system substrate-binding protein
LISRGVWYGPTPVPRPAHLRRRQLVLLALLALAILAAPAVGGADPSQSAASLRALDKQIVAKQRSAVLGLYAIDQQLGTAQAHLQSLRAQAATLRGQRARLALQLQVARRGARIAQQQLGERLRTLYEQGNVTPLEILFGARNLDQAINDLDNLNSATSQDEAVLHEVLNARTQLTVATHGLALRQAALAATTQQAQTTAASLASAHDARTAYVASLATRRRLTEAQIGRLVAISRAAQARTAAIQQAARAQAVAEPAPAVTSAPAPPTPDATTTPATTSASPPPSPYGPAPASSRSITVVATGYSLAGHASTGLPVGWGVAAVDPAVIPLGTHMFVPGYGEAVAADTGGAIVGATIDLWFPTVAQANAWGRRTVTIQLR